MFCRHRQRILNQPGRVCQGKCVLVKYCIGIVQIRVRHDQLWAVGYGAVHVLHGVFEPICQDVLHTRGRPLTALQASQMALDQC
jgi:hypothetical protein